MPLAFRHVNISEHYLIIDNMPNVSATLALFLYLSHPELERCRDWVVLQITVKLPRLEWIFRHELTLDQLLLY